MGYYTPEVKAAVDDVRLMADQVIATTNQGYINSEIPLRAVLHCIEETNEPESAFTLDNRDQGRLGYFRQYKDGGNSLRGSADAAVLIVKDAQGVCGVGYKLRDASNYDDYMVSLTELSCALGGYTFGHELGHNMGLDHDKYADVTRNTPYSQGYHLPGTRYRTILAYSHGDHRLRANHYSNPRVNFKDVPTGDAETADAARRMTEIRFVIGAIGDESEICTTLPAPTTTPAPATTTQAPTTDSRMEGRPSLQRRGQVIQRCHWPLDGLGAKGHLDLRSYGRVDVQLGEQGDPSRRRPLRAVHQEEGVEDHEEGSLPQGNGNTMEVVPVEHFPVMDEFTF